MVTTKVNVYSKLIIIANKYTHYITALDEKGKLQHPSQSSSARASYGESKEFTIDNIPFYPVLTGEAVASYSRGAHSGVQILKKVKDPDGNDFDLTFCVELLNFLSIVKEGGIGPGGEFLDEYLIGGVSGTGILLVKAGTPASDSLAYINNAYVGEAPQVDFKAFYRNQNGCWLLPYKFKKLSTYGYFFCEAEANDCDSHRYIFYLPEFECYLWQISMPQYFEVETNAPVLSSVPFKTNKVLNHWAFPDSPIMNEHNLYVSMKTDDIYMLTVGRSFGSYGNFRWMRTHSTFVDKQLYSMTVNNDKGIVFSDLYKKMLVFEKESDIDDFKNARKRHYGLSRDAVVNMVKSELAKWPDYDRSYCQGHVFEQYNAASSYNVSRSVKLPFYSDVPGHMESYFYDPNSDSYYAVKFASGFGATSNLGVSLNNNPNAIKLIDFTNVHIQNRTDELYLYFTPIENFELVSKFIVGSLDDTKLITLKPISEFLNKVKIKGKGKRK